MEKAALSRSSNGQAVWTHFAQLNTFVSAWKIVVSRLLVFEVANRSIDAVDPASLSSPNLM